MDRRHALLGLAGAALPLALAANRQRALAATISDGDYTTMVLQLGTVAKLTSESLLTRSRNLAARTFARLEVIEQTAAAQALTSNQNPPPPTLTATQKATIAKVKSASVDTLDYTYISVQILGHQALLKLQRELLASDTNLADDIVHIALLLRSNIEQHLDLLTEILLTVSQ